GRDQVVDDIAVPGHVLSASLAATGLVDERVEGDVVDRSSASFDGKLGDAKQIGQGVGAQHAIQPKRDSSVRNIRDGLLQLRRGTVDHHDLVVALAQSVHADEEVVNTGLLQL